MTTSLVYEGFVQSMRAVCMDPTIREKKEMQQQIQAIFNEAQRSIQKFKNANEIADEMTLYFDQVRESLDAIMAQRGKIPYSN